MNNMNKLPNCVGFIMDGNRRYAESLGHEAVWGHVAGKDTFLAVVDQVLEAKIPHAIFYAFSTENWKRSPGEVEALLGLFKQVLTEMKESTKEKCAIRIVGRWSDFREDLQENFRELVAETAAYASRGTIWIALSYGGGAEVNAAGGAFGARGGGVCGEKNAVHPLTPGLAGPPTI